LETNDTSLIIAVFSVAQVIFAPFNALIKNACGAKNTILIGFILLSASTAGLGLIANVKTPRTFKYLAIMLRFF
jgi:MFS family permease